MVALTAEVEGAIEEATQVVEEEEGVRGSVLHLHLATGDEVSGPLAAAEGMEEVMVGEGTVAEEGQADRTRKTIVPLFLKPMPMLRLSPSTHLRARREKGAGSSTSSPLSGYDSRR